jgi:hypothetical protein
MLEVSTHRATEAVRVSQATPDQGWSELLLALPEFDLTDAFIDAHDELVAEIELPRDLQACTGCGTIEQHQIHGWRTHTVRHLPVAGRATKVVWRKGFHDPSLQWCAGRLEVVAYLLDVNLCEKSWLLAVRAASDCRRAD